MSIYKEKITVFDSKNKEMGSFHFQYDEDTDRLYEESAKALKKALIPLQQIDISSYGNATNRNGKLLIKNAEKKVIDIFIILLNSNSDEIKKVFFSNRRPFAAVKGRFYCEECLCKLGEYIATQKRRDKNE